MLKGKTNGVCFTIEQINDAIAEAEVPPAEPIWIMYEDYSRRERLAAPGFGG